MDDIGILPKLIYGLRSSLYILGIWSLIGFIVMQKIYLQRNISSNAKSYIQMILGVPFLCYILCLLLLAIAFFIAQSYAMSAVAFFFFLAPYLLSARSSGMNRYKFEVITQMLAIAASLIILFRMST